MKNPTKSKTYALREADVGDPSQLREVLNEYLLDVSRRIEALEAARGIITLPEVRFDTAGALEPTSAPFSVAAGGVRVSCPFSPTGVVLLRLDCVTNGAAVSSSASDVKWHYAAGPTGGDGVLHIDFVTGLLVNQSYRMLLGVTRG